MNAQQCLQITTPTTSDSPPCSPNMPTLGHCIPLFSGGWLQVASKTLPIGSLMIGVDLAPIKPIRGVKCLLQDITTTQCRAAIKKEAAGSMFDLVLHDGAPNVGGVWQSEAYTQVGGSLCCGFGCCCQGVWDICMSGSWKSVVQQWSAMRIFRL